MNEPVTAFVMDDYRALVRAERGYVATRMEDVRADRRDMYLRHDVALSLERAAEMARVETELGVFATYFVLVSTDLYNPSSAHSRRLLDAIVAGGHEIGLHFDVTQVEGEELEAAAEQECAILTGLTGRSVETISFHRPAKHLLGRPGRFAGRRHTYEPEFFEGIGYISDSNGGWHHGHPLDHPAVAAGHAIQLLTHPIWWVGEGARATVPLVRDFVAERQRQLDGAIAGMITAYAQWQAAGAAALDR